MDSGTRLGHTGPKGTYDIGLPSHKSIFEILTDTMKMYKEKYNIAIPWYIMTSVENNKETVDFFEEKNYFGYGKENIKFFIQGQISMIDENGKILVNTDGQVKSASNGHGGVFDSIINQGIMQDMKEKGVKWIFICGVDNILVKPVDELLLGITIDKKYLSGAKSIIKGYPEERVGIFCKKNGRPSVLEYTEISEEMTKERTASGELKYAETHIVSNLYNIDIIGKMAEKELPYHIAHKKADYINEKGEQVKANEPNAYKFEKFLFDAFEILDNIALLRVKREDEFAPIKNAEGKDSPETAVKLYNDFWNKK